MAGGSNTTEIILQLKLEMTGLQKQQKTFADELKKLTKQHETLSKKFESSSKGQSKALEGVTKSAKKQADEFTNAEKRKRKEYELTNKEVAKQKKGVNELGKAATQGKFGRFLTAFMAGAGVGGIRRSFTAAGFGSLLGRGISRGVGAVMGFGLQGLTSAYQTYVQYGMAQAGMVGLGSSAQLRTGRQLAGRARGARLGYSAIDTAGQATGIARATGNLGAVYRAQQFARATGMDVGEVGGYMGAVRQAGYGFGGVTRAGGVDYNAPRTTADRSGTKVLEKVVAAGIYSGIERARLPEFMQGVAGMTQTAGGRTAGKVNIEGIAAFAALLGKSGQPGLQGARGMGVMQQAMQATVAPGGGEAGQAMMLQALGFGKPGGQTTYYEALKQQQQGMQRPENVASMFKEVYSQLGVVGRGGTEPGQQEANIALSEMTGLSLDQVEALGDILNSGKSAEEQMAAIKDQLKSAEPIEKQALQQMKDFGGTAVRIAGKTDTLIGIGAKVAPMVEKIEKWQLRALEFMANSFPTIEKWLERIYVLIMSAVEQLMPSRAKFDALLKNIDKSMEELQKKYKSSSISEQIKMSKQSAVDAQTKLALIQLERQEKLSRINMIPIYLATGQLTPAEVAAPEIGPRQSDIMQAGEEMQKHTAEAVRLGVIAKIAPAAAKKYTETQLEEKVPGYGTWKAGLLIDPIKAQEIVNKLIEVNNTLKQGQRPPVGRKSPKTNVPGTP